jgi:hypothetical protein
MDPLQIMLIIMHVLAGTCEVGIATTDGPLFELLLGVSLIGLGVLYILRAV